MDYYKISKDELWRLLSMRYYFYAISQLNPTGDFYEQLYKDITEKELDKTLSQDEKREIANSEMEKALEKDIANYKKIE